MKKTFNNAHQQLHQVQTFFQFLRRRLLLYSLETIFSQLKTMGRAEKFEIWPSEKGVNSKRKTGKKKHALG